MSKFSLFFFLYSAQTTHIYSYNSSSVLSTQTQKSFFLLLGIGYTISQLRVNCTVLYFEPSRVARLLSLFAIAARTTESTLRRLTPRRGRPPRHPWKAAAAPAARRRRGYGLYWLNLACKLVGPLALPQQGSQAAPGARRGAALWSFYDIFLQNVFEDKSQF